MALKNAGGGFPRTVDIREEGKVFEGYLLRTREIRSDKIESGTAIVHEFMVPDTGEIVSIWGTGQLNYLLKEVETQAPGALTKITYEGLDKMKQGKKTFQVHKFNVQYDPDKVTDLV